MSDQALSWLGNVGAVESFMSRYDVVDLMEKSDGLVRIDDFLPDFVAEYALTMIKDLPEERWSVRKDADDAKKNTTQHRFYVATPDTAKGDPLNLLTNVIKTLLPEKRSVFSAGRYEQGDHITDHDDHAYVNHEMPDGSDKKPVFCSRDVAVIYYLTKDWKESDGGVLVDNQTGKRYVPKFNSAVIFMVPRFHAVTKVCKRPGRDPRYSIFGWFLTEGDLYNYVKEEEAVVPPRKKKKRRKR
mmetsp:Transcript_15660/g.27321  ORF Transcript_15660/g.27321 Transcript_15660/m.27321 type:complete len:242 (-) Transcript_15660:1709-2434(-)